MSHIPLIIDAIINTDSLPKAGGTTSESLLTPILKVVFSVTGGLSLLFVTIGGFRYIVSHGDPGAIQQAKQTILYAIIGLVVSLVAFSIVTFFINGLNGNI